MSIFKKLTFVLIILFSFNINANNSIKIIGNENIDEEVIYSIIKEYSESFNDDNINLIIKKLKNISGIKNIEIKKNLNNIEIYIVENPKIININFIGNERFKKNEFYEILENKFLLDYYDEIKIDQYVSSIEELYLSFGYNKIQIEYNYVPNENPNFVDLNFNLSEGKISKISKILFIGNNNFDANELKSNIKSKEKNLLSFYTNSNFKLYQFNNDKISLINFYNKNGYKNVIINTKSEFINDKNRFNLYFFIDEGEKYFFDNINLNFDHQNLDENTKENLNNILQNYIVNKINDDPIYNNDHIQNIKEKLTNYLFEQGLMFFEIRTLERNKDLNVDVLFDIKSIKPSYVKNINIFGNTRTLDEVIRREITFNEGDPVNSYLIKESNKNIQRLNFFESIDIKQSNINEVTNINVFVKEKPTGDFKIGASFGSLNGTSFLLGLSEKNIGGKGRNVDFVVDTSDANTTYTLNIVEPYVFNKKLSFIYGLDYSERNFNKTSSYNLDKFEAKSGFSYKFTDLITHSIVLKYNYKDYIITNRDTVASSILKSEGGNTEFLLDNKIVYNSLNSFMRPTNGNYLSLGTSLSPSTNSNNGFVKNLLTHRKYNQYKSNVLSIQTRIGNIYSYENKEILNDNKFSLGGRWLRGFDSYGAGPRNSASSYVGGNNLIVSKIDFTRVLIKNSDNPIDFNLFTDIGKIWENKIDPSNSNESIRSSYGYGIKFYTPIGPVGFSWSYPINSESYDNKRMFLFSIGNLN